MFLVYLLPEDDSYPPITFDLILSESHSHTSEITEHPVEVGANVTDHIRPLPTVLSLELFVTNSPVSEFSGEHTGEQITTEIDVPHYEPPNEPTIGGVFRLAAKGINAGLDAITGGPAPKKAQFLGFTDTFDRIKETHDTLLDLWQRGETMQVVTSTQIYDSMAFAQVQYPRTEAGGASFSLEFKHIRTVTSETVKAPKPLELRGVPKANKGAQGAKKPDGKDAPKAASLAYQALKALGVDI